MDENSVNGLRSASNRGDSVGFDDPARTALEGFRALPDIEQEVLQLVAAFGSSPLSDITNGMGKLGHRVGNRLVDSGFVTPKLTALKRRKMVVENRSRFLATDSSAHVALLSAAETGKLKTLAGIVGEVQPYSYHYQDEVARREFRNALYLGHFDHFSNLFHALGAPTRSQIFRPFDEAWVATFPGPVRAQVAAVVLEAAWNELTPASGALRTLETVPVAELTDETHHILVEQLIFRGRLSDAQDKIARRPSSQSTTCNALLLLLSGQVEASIAAYEGALSAFLKASRKRSGFFRDTAGFFYLFALLGAGTVKFVERARTLSTVAVTTGVPTERECTLLREVAVCRADARNDDFLLLESRLLINTGSTPLMLLTSGIAVAWSGCDPPKGFAGRAAGGAERAAAAGYNWFAKELAAALQNLSDDEAIKKVEALWDGTGFTTVGLYAKKEVWEGVLDALLDLTRDPAAKDSKTSEDREGQDQRLVWVATAEDFFVSIRPLEQTRSKGRWTRGRPVALKRLREQAGQLPWLSAKDREVASLIQRETHKTGYGRYEEEFFNLDSEAAFLTLLDEPNVYVEAKDALLPAQFRKLAPRLRVQEKKGNTHLTLEPAPLNANQNVYVRHGGGAVLEVFQFDVVHHQIAKVLGLKGISAPIAANAKVRAIMAGLSKWVTVEADSNVAEEAPRRGKKAVKAEETPADENPAMTYTAVPGDSRPWFILRGVGEGISVEIQVRPLGKEGPSVHPGQGGRSLFGHVGKEALMAERDLNLEEKRLKSALAACPTLSGWQSSERSFAIPNRQNALEALQEIQALQGGDAAVHVDWPDGQTLHCSTPGGLSDLHIQIKGADDFLTVSGELHLADFGSVSVSSLVDYLAVSPGRFLRVEGNEKFLSLTSELRERLEQLLLFRGLSKKSRDNRLAFHPLAATLLQDIFAGSNLKTDSAFQKAAERVSAGGQEALVPSTFHAELRPYQLDGFRWLHRLWRFGLGGCLADEMGLGKTVQALALLLCAGTNGPSLVVAPTSLVSQWVDEMRKFAPTLRARVYTGEKRGEVLSDLEPMDVVVTSYTLLALDVEQLSQKQFEVAILDEAQAIKNAHTQRAKAAFQLSARARFATTGTPIENRVTELFSLFRFLNDGFLGTEDGFEETFVRPIERDRSTTAGRQLRRLISPFVLRRTKSQVLPELPSRTEVTLRVELKHDELALYEAVREQAILALAKEATGGPKQRFQLLAMIMRLRRAASNSAMVFPDSKAESAKLEALEDLLDELLEGGHKALIFSQFVDHLTLARKVLEKRGIRYQYLDGSTPQPQRKKAVTAFQTGDGDAFLISLKAGGFGLNLTAADTVIHLDPWWNPASEDQASDRAHRLGQVRPVTIYRIVAKQTIEEKILELHHRKREFAQTLLEGSEAVGQLNEEELVELIREGASPPL